MHKTEQDFNREQELDERIRSQMQKKSRLPDDVQRAKERAFEAIEKQQGPDGDNREQKAQSHRIITQAGTESVKNADVKEREKISKIKKSVWKKWLGGVAAAVVAFSCICIANPVLAENIPIIGHVFEMIGNKMQFGGDFSSYAEPVQLESSAGGDAAKSSAVSESKEAKSSLAEETESSQKSDTAEAEKQEVSFFYGTEDPFDSDIAESRRKISDAEITLDESYCSGEALYISFVLKSKEKLIDKDSLEKGDDTLNYVSLYGELDLSYGDGPEIIQNEATGELIDDYTYAGVLRYGLQHTLTKGDNSGPLLDENGKELTAVPEHFTATVKLYGVYFDFFQWYGENSSKNVTCRGAWEFSLDVTVNRENTTTVVINKDGKEKFGVITLKKTPFEISAEWEEDKRFIPEERDDYDIMLMDADGKPMNWGETADEYSIAGHDISEVTAYIIKDTDVMDNVKPYTFGGQHLPDGMTYKDLFEKYAVYSETVSFK